MAKTRKISGTIQAFNVSPKGFYEGFLIADQERVVQVNFPHHLASAISAAVKVGQKVEASVTERLDDRPREHPVFDVLKLEGKTLSQWEKANPGKDEDGSFTGKVKQLNYALHGEVNGAILVSGDFLHLKPKGASAVGLRQGLKVTGYGKRKPMVGGKSVIEASEVNSIAIDAKAKPKKHSR